MSTLSLTPLLTPADVEHASERDSKRYELIDGVLKEKTVGTEALFIASRICAHFNGTFYPAVGFAAVQPMIYCFPKRRHGRKPDVTFVRFDRLPTPQIPDGDIFICPDLVAEVLSPGNSGLELEEKLNEYLDAGVPLVWIVNPDGRTIRTYRQDGTTRLYRGSDTIENDPLLPGLKLIVGDAFPG